MVRTAGNTGDQHAKLKDRWFGVDMNVVVFYARHKQWTSSAWVNELDEGFSSLGYYLSHVAATAMPSHTMPSFLSQQLLRSKKGFKVQCSRGKIRVVSRRLSARKLWTRKSG